MPRYAVECEDGRVFEADAATPEAAIAAIARTRRLRPSSLKALPPPRAEREWAMPVFWACVLAVATVGAALLLF